MTRRRKSFSMPQKVGAIINLDDFTHIEFLEKAIGEIPETISCRFNPGGVFTDQQRYYGQSGRRQIRNDQRTAF